MRCLALAQAWQDAGGAVTFVMATDVPAVQARLEAEGMRVVRINAAIGSADDMAQTIQWARASNARWVVLDGYQFSAENQRALKQAGFSLLWIDDNGDATHYYADIVLNQNLHARASLYTHREPYTELLLGTRYVLLRREFLKWREWRREIPKVARKVLVTLGGSDPDNVTLMVIKALEQVKVDGLEAVVVVGASHPHIHELTQIVQASPIPIRLEINALNMPALMAWADVAITGAGSTCWEFAFMGLPSTILVLAENQKQIGEYLDAQGVAIHLGVGQNIRASDASQSLAGLLTDFERRSTMSRNGRLLVDGQGAVRVATEMTCPLSLRPARAEDCRLIWEWANDHDTRIASFSQGAIPWEHHEQWFAKKLNDPNCIFMIALNSDNLPVAQIRYDLQGNKAIVSVSVAREARGKGYASRVIERSSTHVFQTRPIRTIHAYIKPDNVLSLRAFAKAGFIQQGETRVGDQRAIELVLNNE